MRKYGGSYCGAGGLTPSARAELEHVDLPGGDVWWDVAPAEVSGQEWVQALRAKYEQARGAQKWFG